jgi:hypothetical protein
MAPAAGVPVVAPGAPTPPAVPQAAAKVPAPVPASIPARKQVSATSPKIALNLDIPAAVKLGDQFSVQINAVDANGLYASVFVVKYPKNLEVQTESEGALLKQGGIATRFQAFVDKKKNEIWISLTRTAGVVGTTGSGALATVTFKAIGKGPAAISISNANFTNPAGDPFNVTPSSAAVEVK